jgi:hypothetical protein
MPSIFFPPKPFLATPLSPNWGAGFKFAGCKSKEATEKEKMGK